MKLGANSVLFGGYDMATAFRYIAMAGYDGIEISAIDGMSKHLVLDRWQLIAPEIKRLAEVARQAVRDAFATFGKRGLILSAVPSIRAHWPWENALATFDEWRRLRPFR